jgi:hypothetical protein
MLRFGLFTLGLAALLYAAVVGGAGRGWFTQPSFSEEIVLFLALTHAGLYSFIVRQLGQRPEDFVKIYLGATVMRILFFGLFIFLVLRMDPVGGFGNALFFLLGYFLFTGLEVAVLYRVVSRQEPPRGGQKEG